MNPDIIVVGASKFNLTVDQLLLDDQRFKTITAIKNKQVGSSMATFSTGAVRG